MRAFFSKRLEFVLLKILHQGIQRRLWRAGKRLGQRAQRLIDDVQQIGEGRLFRVDVEDAGENFVLLCASISVRTALALSVGS